MEYYNSSGRYFNAVVWYYYDLYESCITENAVVSPEAYSPCRFGSIPLLELEKVIQLKKLNKATLPSKNIALRQANEIATFILFLLCSPLF